MDQILELKDQPAQALTVALTVKYYIPSPQPAQALVVAPAAVDKFNPRPDQSQSALSTLDPTVIDPAILEPAPLTSSSVSSLSDHESDRSRLEGDDDHNANEIADMTTSNPLTLT